MAGFSVAEGKLQPAPCGSSVQGSATAREWPELHAGRDIEVGRAAGHDGGRARGHRRHRERDVLYGRRGIGLAVVHYQRHAVRAQRHRHRRADSIEIVLAMHSGCRVSLRQGGT